MVADESPRVVAATDALRNDILSCSDYQEISEGHEEEGQALKWKRREALLYTKRRLRRRSYIPPPAPAKTVLSTWRPAGCGIHVEPGVDLRERANAPERVGIRAPGQHGHMAVGPSMTGQKQCWESRGSNRDCGVKM